MIPRAFTTAKRLGWHELRFTEDSRKIMALCTECGRPIWLPASKAGLYKRCGPECTAAYHAKRVADRLRECKTCGKAFYPRRTQLVKGDGRFCSQACNTAIAEANFRPEVQDARARRMRELREAGLIKYRRGADSPVWKGGKAAHLQRRQESGKAAASLRRYRKNNPDKVREFSDRRNERKLGRLPKGTVRRVGGAQRWKCAVCRKGIKLAYHVDHIMPLARGGQHFPANIQLLCEHCNVTKGAQHPIDYMRSLGRLL